MRSRIEYRFAKVAFRRFVLLAWTDEVAQWLAVVDLVRGLGVGSSFPNVAATVVVAPRWSRANRTVKRVATCATLEENRSSLVVELLSGNHIKPLRSLREPRIKVSLIEHIHPAIHVRVIFAAKLRAEEPVAILFLLHARRVVCLEPQRAKATRHDIVLHAEVANEERVQHIVAAHDQFHWPPCRNIQVLAIRSVWILECPVPTRRGDINLIAVGWRSLGNHEPLEAHEEDEDHDDRWKNCPAEFERSVMARSTRIDLATLLSILPHEVKHDADDQHEEEVVDVVEELEHPIEISRHRRGALREPEGLRRNRNALRH